MDRELQEIFEPASDSQGVLTLHSNIRSLLGGREESIKQNLWYSKEIRLTIE